MWFLLLLLHTLAHFGPVNSADQNQGKIILRSKDNPCEGHVEAYYGKQKKKGYVGDKHWSTETEKVVCMSTHCGDSVGTSTNVYRPFGSQVWLNELKCNGNEKSLWECKGWPGPAVSFYKKPTVKKITCSDKITFKLEPHKCEGVVQYTIQSPAKNLTGHICQNEFRSIKTRFKPSRDKCSGNVEVFYENIWLPVLKDALHKVETQNTICKELKCGVAVETIPYFGPLETSHVIKTLDCQKNSKSLANCENIQAVQAESNLKTSDLSGLKCSGYKKPATPPQPTEPTSPVPIIVGVLIVLILVVLIVIFVRYCIKRRNRKSMVPPADMEEVDWDSGDYEDVDKSDEMGSFSRGRFRSDSEMERERDLESNRSYNYDDVDEVTEAQPLTPQGSMVRAAKDEDMQDGIDKPSDEGVTYEVEDSRENYDDIDASPENAKTTAEVHDGPKPASEGDAAAPKDQVHQASSHCHPVSTPSPPSPSRTPLGSLSSTSTPPPGLGPRGKTTLNHHPMFFIQAHGYSQNTRLLPGGHDSEALGGCSDEPTGSTSSPLLLSISGHGHRDTRLKDTPPPKVQVTYPQRGNPSPDPGNDFLLSEVEKSRPPNPEQSISPDES
ncbi:uncharacterized protein FYW61_005212 [Anableps anableps]